MTENNEATPQTFEDLIRSAIPGKETAFKIIELSGGGKRLEIAHRKIQPEPPEEPQLARPLARAHEFHSIDTFAAYLSENTLALADVDNQRISAVLDENMEEDREIVYFQAKTHPTFAPWQAMLGEATPVLVFAVHCMQFRRTVKQPNGMELAHIMSQVKASKVITRQQGIGKQSINGVMVELEIAGERKGVPVELPDSITLHVPLYVGTEPVDLEIDLLVTEVRDQIAVFCTSSQFEDARIAAFEQFIAQLESTKQGRVGFGKITHRDWRVVR